MTNDERAWFSSAAGRKITATEIAEHLGVARNTANKRLADGLSADDLIHISRQIGVNPADALVELNKLTLDEVYALLDSDGKLLATAGQEDLIVALADTLNTGQLAELIARRDRPAPRTDDDVLAQVTAEDLALAAGNVGADDDDDDHLDP